MFASVAQGQNAEEENTMASNAVWWVGSTVAGNEIVANFFSEHAVHEAEVLTRDMLCADGVPRDLWRLSGEQVKHFRNAALVYPHAGFRFFVQNRSTSAPRAADFLLRKKASKATRKTKAQLKALERKASALV